MFAILLFSQNTISILAHPSSQEGVLAGTWIRKPIDEENGGVQYYGIGGEEVGWSIDEAKHTNGTNITYSFVELDMGLTTELRNKVISGASKWNGVVNITHMQTGGTGGY